MPTRLLISLTAFALVAAMVLPQFGCGKQKEAYDSSGGGGDDGHHFVTWEEVRDGSVTVTNPETGVTWTILGIRTDRGDRSRAKQNAEDALTNHPDMAGMVGLWAYNPPTILQAVRDVNKVGQVRIVGFDENAVTLEAIVAGEIVGTVVQNPYEFGFRSVEYLSAQVRGQSFDIPANKMMYIPVRTITADNIQDFRSLTESIQSGNGPIPAYDEGAYDTSDRVSIHFVTNVVDPFWDLANRGCENAAARFNADVSFYMPPNGAAEEQKRHVESMISNNIDGLAISALEPEGQVEMINAAARQMSVMTCDSDSPDSDRLFYLGTDNVAAGYEAGLLLAEACPEGGKVMIFVGILTQQNAHERSQGVINALLGQ